MGRTPGSCRGSVDSTERKGVGTNSKVMKVEGDDEERPALGWAASVEHDRGKKWVANGHEAERDATGDEERRGTDRSFGLAP